MAGDINGFLNSYCNKNDKKEEKFLEISIMIAEKKFRGQGLATEAISLFILYIHTKLSLTNIIAKIDSDNLSSISLFKKLYFIEQKFDKIFNCFTFKFDFVNSYNKISLMNTLHCEVC